MDPQDEPHRLTHLAVASHLAVCSCGSQAPVVDGDAALIWHAIHRLWPWDSPAMLESRIRAAIGPGQLRVPDALVDDEITRRHAEWLRQRWSVAAFTGPGPFSVGETFQSSLGPLPLVPPQWAAMCRECRTSWVPGPWTCPTCGTDNDPDHVQAGSEDPDPLEAFRELRDTMLRPMSIPRDFLSGLPVEQIHLRPRDPDAPDPQPGTPEWDAYVGKGDQVFSAEVLAQAQQAIDQVRCGGCTTVRPVGTADCPKCGSQIWTNATADTTTDGE